MNNSAIIFFILFAISPCAVSQTNQAESIPASSDPIYVTATRPEGEELLVTDVITREDIARSGQNDLPELLQYELGVPVLSSGGLGQSSSVFLRGVESRHTLMLIDGVNVGSATTGLMAMEHFPSFLFNQIDVTRGNVSAIYGSGALGGVINMTTRSGQGKPAFSGQFGFGTHEKYLANVNYSGQLNNTSFFVGANLQGTHGITAMVPGTAGTPNPDKDGYHNQSAIASVSHKLNNGTEFGVHLFQIHANTQYDNVYAPITDDQLIKSDNRAAIIFLKSPITENWKSHFSIAESVDKMKDYSNGLQTSMFETINRQAFWRNEWQAAQNQRLTGGIEWQQQRVSATTRYDKTKRDIGSIYGGYDAKFGNSLVRLNLRDDHYSDVGNAITYLAGYGYQLTPEWQLGGTIGNAFAAPTFNHLFFPNFGNANLKPEKSTNQEISLRYNSRQTMFRTTLFHTRIHDLIGGYPIRNFAKSDIKGIEFDLTYDFHPFEFKTKLTLQSPKDKTNDALLNRRSRQYGMAKISYEKGPWGGAIEWLGTGKRIDNGAYLGAYNLFNFNARYTIHPDWTIGAYVDNALNKKYSALDGYASLRRTVWVQVQYRPNK